MPVKIHPWCSDPSRDAAVRAAEDAAAADRPTLPDHRDLPAAVENLRALSHAHLQEFEELVGIVGRINARLERLEAMIPKTGSPSSTAEHENKGVRMTKSDRQAADYRAEASEREAPAGLRTERVVLEVTHDSHLSLRDWPSLRTFFGESVRVVEDVHFDDLAQVAMERDAAIRERDELQDRLNRCPECNGEGHHDSGGMDASGEWINLPCEGCGSTGTMDGYIEETDKLRARVDKLTNQTIRDHATILNIAAERDAAIRERDNERLVRIGTETDRDFARREKESAIFHITELRTERDKLRDRVAELEARTLTSGECLRAAQAASGGGEGEPVAWGIANPGHTDFGNCEVWTVRQTEEIAKAVYLAADGWQHFPLYAAPPQPRGWLSEEERLLLLSLAESCDIRARLLESPGTMGIGLPKPADVRADAAILRNLLARTKPSGR